MASQSAPPPEVSAVTSGCQNVKAGFPVQTRVGSFLLPF